MTDDNHSVTAEDVQVEAAERTINEARESAERFLRLLFEPGGWREVRALDCPERRGGTYRSTASAYHDDPIAATFDALRLDALGASGVYVTLNPADPATAARAHRRITHRSRNTTGDSEILTRLWLPIDLDPRRPSGVSATDIERDAAVQTALHIREELLKSGWPAPVVCSTPNGAHLLYRIDMPNIPEATHLARRVLAGLAERYGTDLVDVDRAVFNAARILRIPGTLGRKGDSTDDRPHRRGAILEIPAKIISVPRLLLESIATAAPAPTPIPVIPHIRGLVVREHGVSTFDRFDPTADGVRAYLERHGVTVKRTRTDGDSHLLDLESCPIAGSSGGTSISVRIGSDGLVTYHNLHNSGFGLTWIDLRDHLEPGYRTYAKSMKADPTYRTTNSGSGDHQTTMDFQVACTEEEATWDEPVPLTGSGELPKFPVDALPAHLSLFVRELSDSLEVHPDMPAVFALGAGAAASQGRFAVRIKADYLEPLNLFLAAVAPPAGMKSATIRKTLAPIRDQEAEMQEGERENVKRAVDQYHVDLARRERLRKVAATSSQQQDRADALRELEDLPEHPTEPPSLPRLTVGADVTPERLGTLFNQQGGRLVICDAEGGTLFGNFGGRYSSGNPNFEILLKAHAGDDVQIDRQGKPPIFVRHPCLTVLLAIQPDVVRRLADTPQFRERGLAARFNFSFPSTTSGRHLSGPPVNEATRSLYSYGIRAAFQTPLGLGSTGEQSAHELSLTADSFEVFREMTVTIAAQMSDGGTLHGIQDWAGKAHGLAARIAGVLHVLQHVLHSPTSVTFVTNVIRGMPEERRALLAGLDGSCNCRGNPAATKITANTMVNAWRIVTYYKEHALHAYSIMGSDAATDLARRILSWLRETKRTRFTLRECHRRFQSVAPKTSDLNAPLALLVDRNYIRKEPTAPRNAGQMGAPSKGAFTVNPLWQK